MKYKLLSSAFYQSKDFYEQLYTSRINGESTYRFDFKIKGYDGFVVISHEILNKIEQILEIDKNLWRLTEMLPDVALNQYTRTCLIDEIKMTNEIEGVHSTRREINEIMLDQKAPVKYKRFYALVKKYQTLLTNSEIKLNTCEDIRRLYDDFVLKDVVSDDNSNTPDGHIFRADKVYINGTNGQPIHQGITPEKEIIKCMTESLATLNNNDYSFLIRIAVFHYMFGYIHPFYDGNGRMSRFISSYLLSKKLHFLVSCRLSYVIKDMLGSYYKSFKIVNDEKNRGDLTSFVITFLDIIIAAEHELFEVLSERKSKLIFYHEALSKCCKEKKLLTIASILVQNTLFGSIGLNVKEIQEATEMGETSVRKTLKLLEEINILKMQKSGRAPIYDIDLDKLVELS